MSFVQQHLVAHEDLKQIEYAASNGFLQRLDPHSIILEPRQYRDMKVTTRGEFGGLGFVITMRDGNLTVVRVLRNTPAQRAGIRAKDLINKIEEQSTINMDLNDAVDRLRGRPNTRVAITVSRAGWTEPKRLQLTREVINYETVSQAKLLEGGVGYVRLSQFSGNTTRDLQRAIEEQTRAAGSPLKGFVLDLRGNPGGLLDQATDVSDVFLSRGTIVKTVGDGNKQKVREVREAGKDGDDLADLPLVVIVNSSSASASEIVAGALKNNGRALVIGRQTFGKGSVQQLFEFVEPGSKDDEGALKLTTAQYLTPGDISIQEIGITPDVLLLPGRVQKDQVTHFAPPRSMGEADLDGHFTNPGGEKESAAATPRRTAEKPAYELRYVLEEKAPRGAPGAHGADLEISAEQAEDEASEANPDEFVEDYQIQFARDLLGRAPFNERAKLLEAAKVLVQERKVQEEERLRKRFATLGIDWSAGAAAGTPRATVTVTPSGDREVRAGETARWTVTVENRGDAPYRQLRAWSLSEKNFLLDRREFVFGTVAPGEKRSWSVPVKLPRGFDTRRDEVTLHFEAAGGKAPPDVKTTFQAVEIPKPIFAFSLQVDDTKTGNGDGLPQRGETFTVKIDVRNAGPGAAGEKTFVSLKNLGDEKAFIVKGREVLGAIAPGGTKTASLEIELRKGSKTETLPLRVGIVDEKNDEWTQEKVELPIAADATPSAPAKGSVRVDAPEALLRSGASASSTPIATARRGAILPFDARVGEFYRVEWKKGRFAFASEGDVKPAAGYRQGTIAAAWQHEPPRIALDPDPSLGARAVDADTFRLSGVATIPPSSDPDARLRDVFVFVNEKKVFFKVVPENQTTPRMEFQTEIPLKPGNNLVTVFAREDEDFQTRRSFYVLRRTPTQAAQAGQPAQQPQAGK